MPPKITAIYARVMRETVGLPVETLFKPRKKEEPGTIEGKCSKCNRKFYYKKSDCLDLEKIFELACSPSCSKELDWIKRFPGFGTNKPFKKGNK